MEKQKSIKKNIVMSIIQTTSNFLFPLVTYSYVARVLMAEGTGKVAFVQSVLSYFSYFAALGISGYGMRECAKVRDNKEKLSEITHELFIINMISTIFAYIALILVLFIIKRFHAYIALFVAMGLNILLQTLGMEWLYKALEKYTYITIRSIVFKSISVLLIFLLIKEPKDYVRYAALTIFSTGASNVLNFVHARKYIDYKKIKFYNLKIHLKPIIVFFMSSIIITVYAQFDTIMLGLMRGDAEVGIYNAALKMKTVVLSVSTAVTSVLSPRMVVYVEKGENENFKELLVKSLRLSCVLLFPLVFFVLLNTKDIILFVCGAEYLPAVPTLIVLMICVFALMLTNIFGNHILISKNDEKRYSVSVFLGMWINLCLNRILIPKYASVGAAIATLVTEVFNVYWMGRGCREEIMYMARNISVKKYILPLLIGILFQVSICVLFQPVHLFLKLLINMLVLFGVYYLLLFIEKEPTIMSGIETVRNIFERRLQIR